MIDSLPLAALALVLALALGASATPARAQSSAAPRDDAAGRARALVARLATGALSDAETERLGRALSALGEVNRRPLLAVMPDLPPREAALALRLLAEHPADAVRDELVRASCARSAEVRRAAIHGLARFSLDPRAGAALVGLTTGADRGVAEEAFGALASGEFPGCWDPLLDALVLELREDDPRPSRAFPLMRCLEAVLRRADPQEDHEPRLRRLLEACASLDDPSRRDRLFLVLASSRASSALPWLTRVLSDALHVATPEAPWDLGTSSLLDEAFAPGGALEALRPWSAPLLADVAKALGRAAHAPAFDALLKATADRRPELRRAALDAAVRCAPDEAARGAALRALVDALGAADRGLRARAHELLRRHTAQDLPLSAPRWLAWLEAREAARALEERARAAGYERLDEFLLDHPDEAPPAPDVEADAAVVER